MHPNVKIPFSSPPIRSLASPEGAECGSRSIPRIRQREMGSGFFSPVPFRVWAAKKYSQKSCKYRRNEVPQWNPLNKKDFGWNDKGIIFKIRGNGRACPAPEAYKISALDGTASLFRLHSHDASNHLNALHLRFLHSEPDFSVPLPRTAVMYLRSK